LPVEEAANITENFVHHEDVLRAQPNWTEPRSLDPDYEEALWKAIVARNRFFLPPLTRRGDVPTT
jgi:hypothetical protein